MKITVLSEVKAKKGFETEHGLSFFIEADGQPFLFDTGASDIFLRNAEKLGLDLGGVARVILSHGHWDHGDGLQFLERKELTCHPECFLKRYRKSGGDYLGLALDREEMERKYTLLLSREPVKLTEHLYFLGEIPRINDFEAKTTGYLLEGDREDYITDDSGLAYVTDRGVVVISGCAHSGICNMVEHARKITATPEVRAVIGGFHLKTMNEQTRRTIQCLKDLSIDQVYPSHCTQAQALKEFHAVFGKNEVLAGDTIYFN